MTPPFSNNARPVRLHRRQKGRRLALDTLSHRKLTVCGERAGEGARPESDRVVIELRWPGRASKRRLAF